MGVSLVYDGRPNKVTMWHHWSVLTRCIPHLQDDGQVVDGHAERRILVTEHMRQVDSEATLDKPYECVEYLLMNPDVLLDQVS